MNLELSKYKLLLCATLSALSLNAQVVNRVTVGDNMNYGVTYNLPTTVVKVEVDASCTEVKAGMFAPYAEKFLGLKDVPHEDKTLWQVEAVRLIPDVQADSAQVYHIVFSEKGALPTFYFSQERTLLAINHEVTPADEPEPVAPQAEAKLTFKPSDVMTSEMLKAGSKAKQAELVAEEILSIRESRSELVRGEADNMPKDGKQLQLMLDNLSAQEAALMSLFVGTTTTSQSSHTYSYHPTQEVERELLFRFSSQLGFVDADDYAGAPYYVSLAVIEDNRMPMMDAKAIKKLEKGIAFCVPGKAHITLFCANQKLAEGDMRMAQFGHVEQLPQAQFTDKKRPCAATFDATTGSLHLFEQGAE